MSGQCCCEKCVNEKPKHRHSTLPWQSQGGRHELESGSEKTQKARKGSCYALLKYEEVEEADS